MANTVSVSKTQYEELLKRIDRIEKIVKSWVKREKGALGVEPSYGSEAWWEKEEAEADEDIKAGRVYGPFNTAEELIKSLHKESAKLNKTK